MPISGRHSTIDNPLPVRRVTPPINTITATSEAMVISHQKAKLSVLAPSGARFATSVADI